MRVDIDGKIYTIKENLGFQGGYHTRIIDYNGEDKVAIYKDKRWQLRTPADKFWAEGK